MPGAIDDSQPGCIIPESKKAEWNEFLGEAKKILKSDLKAILKFLEQGDLKLDDPELLDALIVVDKDIRKFLYTGFNAVISNLPDDKQERQEILKPFLERLMSLMV